ncbi:MAG TPA: hypothetical protein VMV48_00905, partial [Gallionellaceae bacterium]|nr:hypothetical protein [Gallionellaceae bacterium]
DQNTLAPRLSQSRIIASSSYRINGDQGKLTHGVKCKLVIQVAFSKPLCSKINKKLSVLTRQNQAATLNI